MRKLLVLVFAATLLMFTSCTENDRAKNWGGTIEIDLPIGEKLVNVTWKEDNLWYLTKPMTETDTAETYMFREKSSFGNMEGTIIIKEVK